MVLAEGKEPRHLREILETLRAEGRPALISRPTPEQSALLEHLAQQQEFPLSPRAGGRLWYLDGSGRPAGARGTVGLVTAGTADVPIAEEAKAVLELSGASTVEAYDVGVAGLHRVTDAAAELERSRPEVYLVFAGREGALPTVWAGLVRAPVVGVPTSVGYGRGGKGEAALGAMLQSCAPVAVVNIDAAVPAALFALQLLAGGRRRRTDRSVR